MHFGQDFAFPTENRRWGSWNYLLNKEEGIQSASFVCLECGTFGVLEEHEIAADGTVSPSVVCPNCSFHQHIKLDGWDPERLK